MLLHRVLSALVGIPFIIVVVWYGQIPLMLLTGFIMLCACYELKDILFEKSQPAPFWLMVLGSLLLLANAYIYHGAFLGLTVIMVLLLNLLSIIIIYPDFSPSDGASSLYGTLYVGLIVYLYLLRVLPDGTAWLIFALTNTWAGDTGAYFIGRTWGKHKLAPKLSPKKTIEGAVGGVICCLLAAAIFHFFYPATPLAKLLILSVLVAFAGLLGDLVESVLKRQAGIKDSGKIIPGHGGVLDRFDSFLLTAPLVYYYVNLTILG